MTRRVPQSTEPLQPTRVIGERVAAIRRYLGLTQENLAEEMRALGIEWQRIIVAKLEKGRRSFVTVDELLGLCVALKISPVDLLVPKDAEDMQPYLFTPTRETWAASAREFIRGEAHLYIHKSPEPLDPGFPFASPGTMIDSTQWMPADRANRVDELYSDEWLEEEEEEQP